MELKEYTQRRNWAFRKLLIESIIIRFFRNLCISKCPKCKKGRVRYIGDDWRGHTWIRVYECNKCKHEFI